VVNAVIGYAQEAKAADAIRSLDALVAGRARVRRGGAEIELRADPASRWDARTSVAREAADVVLTDDNFATIRAAVEEGRRVYDNLVKALAFVLPTNLGEGLIILIAILAFPITGGEALLPASPVQILWINLVAAVTLALPLAFEAMEPGLMRRAPRPPDEPLLSRFVITRTVIVALPMTGAAIALFLLHRRGALDDGAGEGAALAGAQTVVVTMIVLFQILYLLQSRTRTRPLRRLSGAAPGRVVSPDGRRSPAPRATAGPSQ
jgi:magnesium-transporting ATPase (P-type)